MTQSREVKVSDRVFGSLTKAAEYYRVPLSTAAKRIGKGWTPEQAFGLESAPTATGSSQSASKDDADEQQFQSKSIQLKGKTYSSIAEFARAFNKKPQLVRSRLHRGMSPADAVELSNEVEAEQVKFKIDGNTFASIDELAKHYHANPNSVQEKINKGWSVAQAVGLMRPPQASTPYNDVVSLSVQGKTYSSIKDIATAFGLEHTALIREISVGKSAEEAVSFLTNGANKSNKPDSETKEENSVVVFGKTYQSLHQVAKSHSLNISSFYQRLAKGDTPEEAVKYLSPDENDPTRSPGKRGRRGNAVEHDGKTFSSVREFAKHYGVSPHKVAYRLKSGSTLAEAIAPKPRLGSDVADKISSGQSLENIVYRGEEYSSVRALANAFSVSPHKVRYRLINGWTVAQAVEKAKPPVKETKSSANGSSKQVSISTLLPLEIDGLSFNSARELADHFNLNAAKVTGRLRNGWTVEQAVEKVAHKRAHKQHTSGKLKVGKQTFSTVIEMAEAFSVSYRVVQYRLGQGATPAQAVGKEEWSPGVHKGKGVFFRDRHYPSLIELAKAFKADYNKMIGRMHRGWTLAEAVGVEKRKRPSRTGAKGITKSKAKGKSSSNMIDDMFPDLDKKISLGSRKFKSVSEFAEFLELDPLITANRLKDGWTPKQIAGKEAPPNW